MKRVPSSTRSTRLLIGGDVGTGAVEEMVFRHTRSLAHSRTTGVQVVSSSAGTLAMPTIGTPGATLTSGGFIMQLALGLHANRSVCRVPCSRIANLVLAWPILEMVCWSKVENYAPWLVRGWDVNHPHNPWRVRILGVRLVLFGITV